MARTAKTVMTPRDSVFNADVRNTVAKLKDLEGGVTNPVSFFEESHFTKGLTELCKKGFSRLSGEYGNGVFELTQSMGGGNTHSLMSFSLLARDPELRSSVLRREGVEQFGAFGSAKIVVFEGEDNLNLPYGLWGEIARQLRKLQEFSQFYSPLSAPSTGAWTRLIGDEPGNSTFTIICSLNARWRLEFSIPPILQ